LTLSSSKGRRGDPVAFLFAQTYRPQDATHDFQVLGMPTLIGEAANRFV
jgi:hypothetical protein